MRKLSDIREDYTKGTLTRTDLVDDPIEQFNLWINQAIECKCLHPNAMSLASVDKEGMPSVRVVLLKDATKEGFVFFTNYESQKGTELITTPKACLNFFWGELERQVRINGSIHKISPLMSDEYFQSRPRESQLGALASPQSQTLENDQILPDHYQRLQLIYQNQPIPRPDHWGGFLLKPERMEFWQGRASRLHDRFKYTRQANSWRIERIAP